MVGGLSRRQYSMMLQRSMALVEYNDDVVNGHGQVCLSRDDLIITS
jgi:hypothetical protein